MDMDEAEESGREGYGRRGVKDMQLAGDKRDRQWIYVVVILH